jgi:hypothetical protein
MAYQTSAVVIGNDWTKVVDGIALIQFNDKMYMALTGGGLPTETIGFSVKSGEKYINNSDAVTVWARRINSGDNVVSALVAKDVV